MSDLRQVGFIGKNVQGNRAYDAEGISATLASQTGGLGGTGAGVYLINENLPKGSDNLTNISEVFEGKPFTYVSLFSGVGGFEQALNKLGGTCVMASEIDKFANQAYEVLYGHKTVGDVTKIEAVDVPDHDLLVGGFPCQAFSVAGKRLGFEDTRGTLFFEMARIAKTKKPKVILAENVKGLVGHDKGRTLNTIIQALCDIGYTVDFNVLNSKYFGVPQNRERIFIVAVRDDLITPEPWQIEGTNVVAKGKRRISQLDGIKTFNFDWPEQTEVTTRLRDILESNVDERYYLSEEKTAKLVAELEVKDRQVGTVGHHPFSKKYEFNGYNSEISPALIATDYKAPKTVLESAEPQMLGHIDINGHDAIKRIYSAEGVSTMGGGHREPKIAEEQIYSWEDEFRVRREEQPRLNIVGHSGSGGQKGHIYATDGLMSCLTATDYKQPKQIVDEVRPVLTPDRLEKRQNGRRFKGDGEESFTITAQDKHGVAIGNPQKYRIRKLTPRECFRLQGFPDSEFEKLVAAGISNSQLYKMAGNAVTVNVIDAIGRRLLAFLN